MKCVLAVTSRFAVISLLAFGQQDKPTFQVEVKSAFVWGEDSAQGVESSLVQDPLTGRRLPKLSYAGIEVTPRIGFERIGIGQAGVLLGFTATVVNDTSSTISVTEGGISIDDHPASLLAVVRAPKHLKTRESAIAKHSVDLQTMDCFKSGFLPSENLFGPDASSEVLSVPPGTALTVTSVTKNPRADSVRCSIEGCYPTGTMRYYITVNARDYVFVMPAHAATYCGK
jgi:hypothetical protein